MTHPTKIAGRIARQWVGSLKNRFKPCWETAIAQASNAFGSGCSKGLGGGSRRPGHLHGAGGYGEKPWSLF